MKLNINGKEIDNIVNITFWGPTDMDMYEICWDIDEKFDTYDQCSENNKRYKICQSESFEETYEEMIKHIMESL